MSKDSQLWNAGIVFGMAIGFAISSVVVINDNFRWGFFVSLWAICMVWQHLLFKNYIKKSKRRNKE